VITRAAGVCLALFIGASVVHAGGDSAIRVFLGGRGTPGGSALVRVSSAGDSSRHREARIDDAHPAAHFDLFGAGDHDISVTLADGRTATARVGVLVNHTAVVVIAHPVDAGAPPAITLVDAVPAGDGARFDERALRDLPSADNLWSLVETAAPFVIVDRLDTGGLGTGRSALMGSRGESWGLTTVSFGGLLVRSPTRTGLLAALPEMTAAAEVSVNSGLASIEVDTPGVVIEWKPRRPGPSWSGGVDASVTTPGMVGENSLPHAPSLGRIEDWRNAGVFAGGPLADHTGLFVSTGITRATHLERDAPRVLASETRSVTAHLVSSPTTFDQVRVLAAFEDARYPFDTRRQFADPDVNERATFGRAQLSWDRVGTGGSLSRVAVGYQRGAWEPGVSADAVGGTMDRVRHGAVPPSPSDSTLTQWDARAEGATRMRRIGRTAGYGRAGITIRRSSTDHRIVATPTVAETVAGFPARVWVPVVAGSSSARAVTEIGLFGAGQLLAGPRFTLDLGVRADLVRGSNGGGSELRWNTLSPRVSFRWSPAAISFFGGVGRYAGGHPLSFLAFGDPGEATWDVYRWTDPNADGRFDPSERGALVARTGSGAGVGTLDPDLRVPRTTEWVAGAEVRPTRHSVLRGAIVIRRQSDLVGVLNTGLSASDYRESFVPDINADEGSAADDRLLPIYERLPGSFGRDALRLTNPAADPIEHDGIELTYEISSPRWFMLFGATAYRTLGQGGALGHGVLENDQLVLGDRYWNPNALKDEPGRLFFDRAYVGKWTTAYRARGDVRLAAVVRYQDGQPFTRYVVAPDLAGGPEITHAYPVGRTRFTYTATVDVRMEKGVNWGTGRRASVRLDVFNLTNHANELEEDVLSGPTFRLSSIVQPPRTLRLGVRVEF
jgi:hypothetical protein